MKKYAPILKTVFGLLLLALIIWKVDWAETWSVLSGLSIPYIAALLFISLILVVLSCVKWQMFLKGRGTDVSLRHLVELYLIGYFFNNFSPGNVGGDVVRGYVLGQSIGSQSESFGTVFLERFTGFAALIGMAVAAAVLRPSLLQNPALALVIAGMAVGFAVFLLTLFSGRAQAFWNRLFDRLPSALPTGKLRKFVDVIFYFKDHRAILIKALALSVAFYIMTIVNTEVACLSLGIDVEVLDLAVIVPVVLLIAAVPISMNALGIMEGSFVYFLGLVGVDAPAALSVALILRAKNLLLALFGGVLFLFWKQKLAKAGEYHA